MTTFTSRGWLDLQVNGYGGFDYNADSLDVPAVRAITGKLLERGVAHHLPTLITGPSERTMRNAAIIAEARDGGLAELIPGLHLEGPFISPNDGARGAHPAAHCRLPDLAWIEDVQAAAAGAVRLVTLAPELPGALELTRTLSGRGILVAIGHSDAPPELLAEAAAAGARLVTHFGNGIRTTLPRHPNLLWEALASELSLSVILDGHHLPASVAQVAYRVKGAGGLCIISDSVELASREPGRYRTAVGDEVELLPNGRLQLAGTPYLAGSSISMLEAVRFALQVLRWPISEVARMAADTPARLIGFDCDSSTTIAVDPEGVQVVAVTIRGQPVYEREVTA